MRVGSPPSYLSLVVPCYNEVTRLPCALPRLARYLESLGREFEIIVSDDGSTDSTPALPWPGYRQQFRVSYVRSGRNFGKGAALKRGIRAAAGRFVFFTDADLAIDLEALGRSLSMLEHGDADIVVGDRRLAGSRASGRAPLHRRVASKLYNLTVQMLLLPGYTDTQCPMKGFRAAVLGPLLEKSTAQSYCFDDELIYLALLHGLRVKRVPVTWEDSRRVMELGTLAGLGMGNLFNLLSLICRAKLLRSLG